MSLKKTRRWTCLFRREVLPYTPEAWIEEASTKISRKVSFTRHCHKHSH